MKILSALAFVLCALVSTGVEATTISVDAYLSHPDLSIDSPIDYSVRFPTSFTSIESLRFDAYWVGDGLDPGDVIAFAGADGVEATGLGGFGNNSDATQFHRALTFPASLGFEGVLAQFLDGAYDGRIFADCRVFNGGSCVEFTTATFDRLVFTVEGEPVESPTPVPEPATLALLAVGIAPGLLALWGRDRRARGSSDG